MKYRILCCCAVFAFAVATTSAQMKPTTSGKCSKPDVQQNIPAGDQSGHAFALAQGKCVTKGEVGGATSKEGAFSEHQEISGDHLKVWGVYVETYDSGDKVFYTYQSTGTLKDGALQTGQNKYQVTGGTGKMKGIKGSGTCKFTGNSDGGLDYSCTGEAKKTTGRVRVAHSCEACARLSRGLWVGASAPTSAACYQLDFSRHPYFPLSILREGTTEFVPTLSGSFSGR